MDVSSIVFSTHFFVKRSFTIYSAYKYKDDMYLCELMTSKVRYKIPHQLLQSITFTSIFLSKAVQKRRLCQTLPLKGTPIASTKIALLSCAGILKLVEMHVKIIFAEVNLMAFLQVASTTYVKF